MKIDGKICNLLSAGGGDKPFLYKCDLTGGRIEVSHNSGMQVLVGEIIACGEVV